MTRLNLQIYYLYCSIKTIELMLPGVLAETGVADVSVRSYVTWSGTHTATTKKWEMKAYHTWDFKDGLIISGGDYFDASGLINFLQADATE